MVSCKFVTFVANLLPTLGRGTVHQGEQTERANTVANYCVECKFAGKTSGSTVYCNKRHDWMDKYASCADYVWIRARSRAVHSLLMTLLHLFPH